MHPLSNRTTRTTKAILLGTLMHLALDVGALADCTGCDPGPGFRHLFDERGNPRILVEERERNRPILTIDPRGVIWYKGKRADDLSEEELQEVIDLLLQALREDR